MIDAQAREALEQYLEEEHCESNVIKENDETGLKLLHYEGHHDIVGDTTTAVIHSLITLAPHKGRECWIGYMTAEIDGWTVAAVTHHSSYGEHVDDTADVNSIFWIGKGDIPKDVENAMRTYHAKEVASDYASRIAIMNYALDDIAAYLPTDSRKALSNSLTQLMRTNLL